MDSQTSMMLSEKYVAHTYARYPVLLVRGKGTRVWDPEGKEYLDFVSGLAVCNLGHCHPKVVKAIQAQAEKLIHVSNFYYIEPQIQLASLLASTPLPTRSFSAIVERKPTRERSNWPGNIPKRRSGRIALKS